MKWWKRAIGFLREMNINKREREVALAFVSVEREMT